MHEANGTIYRFGTQNSTTAIIITASTNNINNRMALMLICGILEKVWILHFVLNTFCAQRTRLSSYCTIQYLTLVGQ